MKCEIKYAPKNLAEVIYPSVAVERRIKGYATGQLEGHILLHGTNGTGKSTVAKLLVDSIGGANASVEYGVFEDLLEKNDLRGYLMNAASVGRLSQGKKHFLVLDEFDQAKKNLGTFWRALDVCGTDVMAIITTNKPMEIEKAIRSRFDLIEMNGLCAIAALPRIQFMLQSEGLNLPDQQVLHYLKLKERWMDMRKYAGVVDELLFLHNNQLPMPPWTAAQPNLKVV
jgi:replication-associated recombination protein RarA